MHEYNRKTFRSYTATTSVQSDRKFRYDLFMHALARLLEFVQIKFYAKLNQLNFEQKSHRTERRTNVANLGCGLHTFRRARVTAEIRVPGTLGSAICITIKIYPLIDGLLRGERILNTLITSYLKLLRLNVNNQFNCG